MFLICETDDKTKAAAWLLSEVCKSQEEVNPGDAYEPILTGSAAESTQALFINEFDYHLCLPKQYWTGQIFN